MTEEDEKGFMEFVMSTGRIEIIPEDMESRDDRWETLSPWIEDTGHSDVFFHNTEIPGELFYLYSQQKGVFSVSTSESPIVEFSRSIQRRNALMSGRLYAVFKAYSFDEDAYVPKDPAFDKWYEKIVRWIKRRYRRLEWNSYAGPKAMDFKRKGGKFRRFGQGWE
ncbi:MAG: hypothetical protein V3U51_02880 [Thermoplasmata archaeon]